MNRPTELVFAAARRLAEAQLPSPATDARLLLAHATGLSPREYLLLPEVEAAAGELFWELVERRARLEPVQHITGVAPFRYSQLRVGPGVFIPRPETELLVEFALTALKARQPSQRRVVELGAGSGAIIGAIGRELPGCQLHAVEISAEAWPYLQENLADLEVELVLGDMAAAFPELVGGVDLVISNPPYLPESDKEAIPKDVAGHDPELALYSGTEGLDAIRVVAEVAKRLLKPTGLVAVEHDERHAAAALEIFAAPDFADASTLPDLVGRPRFVTAQLGGMAGLVT